MPDISLNSTGHIKPSLDGARCGFQEYGCVITPAICSTLNGSILGIRFRFLALPPVIVLGAACFAALSNAQGATLSQTIVPIVRFATLPQLGYLCTALLEHAVTPAHAGGRRPPLGTPKLR